MAALVGGGAGISLGGAGALRLGPATNAFSGSTRTAAETARNTYATANASWLAIYDADPTLIITLSWTSPSSETAYQSRRSSAWYDVTAAIRGPTGATGAQGPAGSDGQPGADGMDGADGLTEAEVDERVGVNLAAAVSGNTEEGITVTYNTGDGTIDFSALTQVQRNWLNSLAALSGGDRTFLIDFANNASFSNIQGFDALSGGTLSLRYNDTSGTERTWDVDLSSLESSEPATNTRYLAVKTTTTFTAGDFTGGESSTDGTFTIPSFTDDQVYVGIAQPSADDDLTSIEIANFEQIGAFTKATSTLTISGVEYEYWVSDHAQEDHIIGVAVEVS